VDRQTTHRRCGPPRPTTRRHNARPLPATLGRTPHSAHRFRPDPVPDAVIYRMLDNARFTPSGNNRQPWHVIVVCDPGLPARPRDLYRTSCWHTYHAPLFTPPGQPPRPTTTPTTRTRFGCSWWSWSSRRRSPPRPGPAAHPLTGSRSWRTWGRAGRTATAHQADPPTGRRLCRRGPLRRRAPQRPAWPGTPRRRICPNRWSGSRNARRRAGPGAAAATPSGAPSIAAGG